MTDPSAPYQSSVKQLIGKTLDWLLSNAEHSARRQWAEHRNRNQALFETYLTTACARCSSIKNILYANPVALDSIYINTLLSYVEKYQTHQISDDKFVRSLQRGSKIVIQASAGAGKSLLLKYVFLRIVADEVGGQPTIPIFLEMRKYNDASDSAIDELIHREITVEDDTVMREQIVGALAAGRFSVLLDGFAELIPAKKRHYESSLSSFCRKYPDNIYIVSTRPDEALSRLERFINHQIVPLDRETSINLLSKLKFDEAIKTKFIERVRDDLFETHRSFLQVPLLCVMMLVTFSEKAEIEPKLSRFYQDCFTALYYLHDVRKEGFRRVFFSGLNKEQFFDLFAAFSFITYASASLRFTDIELEKAIKAACVLCELRCGVEELIRDLTTSVCLIFRDGHTLTFSRRSFQEYFAAEFVSKCADEQAMAIIEKISERSDVDNVIPILREINPLLLEAKWLLPTLEGLITRAGEIGTYHAGEVVVNEVFETEQLRPGKGADGVAWPLKVKIPVGGAAVVAGRILQVTEVQAVQQEVQKLLNGFVGALAEEARVRARVQLFKRFVREGVRNGDLLQQSVRLANFIKKACEILRSRHSRFALGVEEIIGRFKK